MHFLTLRYWVPLQFIILHQKQQIGSKSLFIEIILPHLLTNVTFSAAVTISWQLDENGAAIKCFFNTVKQLRLEKEILGPFKILPLSQPSFYIILQSFVSVLRGKTTVSFFKKGCFKYQRWSLRRIVTCWCLLCMDKS